MEKQKIVTFFITSHNQDKEERELNDFLSQDHIEVEQIFQSSASVSSEHLRSDFMEACVVITILYREKTFVKKQKG